MSGINKLFKRKVYVDPALNVNASEFEVNNWIISEFVIDKLVSVVGVHPFPLNELMLLSSAVCRFKPALIFEWGTNIGKSARVFYETIKSFNINCQIHSIDLPDNVFHKEHPQTKRGIFVKGIKEVTLHQADGLSRSFEIYDKSNVNDNVLFFVDGDHSYETVKNELSSILKHIPNAIVILHDTFFQSSDSGYNVGPNKALKEIIGVDNYNYNIISTNTGLPGMTLIFKKR
jgi:cephalosporin hydroxylase